MSASMEGDRQHLDATADREVVFCHSCSFEWYNQDHGLQCPRCHSEITEVINPSEDPRNLAQPIPPYHPTSMPGFQTYASHGHGQNDDSDPEEADIEEHLGSYNSPFHPAGRAGGSAARHWGFDPHGAHTDSNPPGHDHFHHHAHTHEPSNNTPVDPVLQRFADMLQGFGPPTRSRGSPMPLFPGNSHAVQRTTFTSRTSSGGTASVTIFRGPAPGFRRPNPEASDPFHSFFHDALQDMDDPPGTQGPGNNEQGAPFGFAQSLQEILNLFNPSNAAIGDAVYSQEALDRIITNLMEQNPQSNAAPPASDEALQKLDRRPFTKDMLGEDGKAECAICLDDFEEGQTAAFLPCKHWFHEPCVVLWLKEHNTCPVCRTPMESRGSRTAGGTGAGNSDSRQRPSAGDGHGAQSSEDQPDHSAPTPQLQPESGSWGGNTWHSPGARFTFYRVETPRAPERPSTLSRPPSHSQTPLNQIIRGISSSQREQRNRDRQAAAEQSYDTSRFQQRRTSLSPTAPRAYDPAELRSRVRQRSPSSSERRRTPPEREDSNSQSSGGAFGWLRDRFGGSSREGRGS
ncbi:ring finger domain-containing protein [Sarocladium implicatum]|nr:ring finger domain-containing protein [Sarocladium implicatum]